MLLTFVPVNLRLSLVIRTIDLWLALSVDVKRVSIVEPFRFIMCGGSTV